MHRFYLPPEGWDAEPPTLGPDESHHCVHVLRCQAGDKVVVFDGRGNEATAVITGTEPRGVTVEPGRPAASPPLPTRLALAQAVPKGKTMELIVQKATELGAADIFPVLSERTVVRADAGEAEKKRAKWQQTAIAACKQSGQNWLPTVHTPAPPDRFFGQWGDFDLVLVASLQPDSRGLKEILAEHEELHGKAPASALVLVGPEGDFTPAEINLAKSGGAQPVGLGPIVLRAETAAFYTLAVLGHELF